MASITSIKTARFDWLRTVFAGPFPPRNQAQSKTRKANSITHTKKMKQKTIWEYESKEKHLENNLNIQTIQFETTSFLLSKSRKMKFNSYKAASTRKKASFISWLFSNIQIYVE